jgi:hypothetical protein
MAAIIDMELKFSHAPSVSEIVDAFPDEARELAPRELRRWKKALSTYLRKYINPPLRKVSSENRTIEQKLLIARWPHWEVIQTLCHRIKRLERIIKAVQSRGMGKKALPVEEAREFPIDRLCADGGIELRRVGRYLRGICPFHDDHDPSLVVYPENNRWHCFGCGEGGDAIAFTMKLNGLDFKRAVKNLIGGIHETDKHISGNRTV